MTKIKTNLFGKNVEMKLAEGNSIAPLLKADSNPQVKAAGNTLIAEGATLLAKNTDNTQKHDAAKAATVALQAQEIIWDQAMKDASAKVMEIYPANSAKWATFGFQIGSVATAAPIPAQIQNLSVTHSDIGTDNDLHWDSIKGVNAYKIQECVNLDPTVEVNWKPATPDISTKSKTTVTVTLLVQTWFRVLAVNAAGQGAWSNPAKASA